MAIMQKLCMKNYHHHHHIIVSASQTLEYTELYGELIKT